MASAAVLLIPTTFLVNCFLDLLQILVMRNGVLESIHKGVVFDGIELVYKVIDFPAIAVDGINTVPSACSGTGKVVHGLVVPVNPAFQRTADIHFIEAAASGSNPGGSVLLPFLKTLN